MSTKLRVILIVVILLLGFFFAWYVNFQQESKIISNMDNLNTIDSNSVNLNLAIEKLSSAVNMALESSFQTDQKQLDSIYKNFNTMISDFGKLSSSLKTVYPSYKAIVVDANNLSSLNKTLYNLIKTKISKKSELKTLYTTYANKENKIKKLHDSLMNEGKKTNLELEKQLLDFIEKSSTKYATASDEEKDKIISSIQDYDYSKYTIRDQLYVLKQLISKMNNKDLLMSINQYYLLLYMLLYEPSDPDSTDLMSDASDYYFNGSANITNPVYAAFINTVIPNLTMVWTNLQTKSASYSLAKASLNAILPKITSLNNEIESLNQKIQQESQKYTPILASIHDHVKFLRETNNKLVNEALINVQNSIYQAREWNLIIFILTVILGILLSIFVILSIKKPIDSLIEVAKRLGEGDLTVKVDSKTKASDMVILLSSFSTMTENLKNLIIKLNESSDSINNISHTLSSSVEETTASIEEVSSNMDHTAKELDLLSQKTDATTASLDNIQNTIQRTTDSNNLLTQNIKNAIEKVDENKNIIMDAVSLMSETAEIVKTVAVVVGNLEKPTEEIKNFVKIVSTIANQTNLLALNAAIEAARAGESGKGFAVVADEIRQLAEESLSAAEKIKETVNSIVDGVDNATTTMEIGNLKVSGISEMTSKAKDSLESISTSLKGVSETIVSMNDELVGLNSSAANEISNIKDVIGRIDNISSIVADVNASMEEQSAAMVNLANLADQLSNMIVDFKQIADKFKIN